MRNFRVCSVSAALLVMAPATTAAGQFPISVKADDLAEAAFYEIESRIPGITLADVELMDPVFFNCSATSDVAGPDQLETAGFNCMATVNFDVSAARVEHFYVDEAGNCLRQDAPETASVHLRQGDENHVHFGFSKNNPGRVVDCDDEAITRIAGLKTGAQQPGAVFEVDATQILDMAFAAAIEVHGNIPPEKIVFGDGPSLSVTCAAQPAINAATSLDVNIGPCSAMVMLANESVMLEYRYISGISCMIGKASDWITVEIDEFGLTETTARNNSGGGIARGVECDEAFYSSPLPFIESP